MEPVHVRSVRFDSKVDGAQNRSVFISASQGFGVTDPIEGAPGHQAAPGVYLHRDDIIVLLNQLREEAPQGALAGSWLLSAIDDIRSRGA